METEGINKIFSRGTEEVILKDHLLKRLKSGEKLRIKLGIDPTASDLHLGHSVVLRKLRQFQNLGHKAVLIIGDFTGKIGDPSGRDSTRPILTKKEIKENLKSYLKQAGKIIDIKKAEIHYNSKWLEKKGLEQILLIARSATIQQVLKREDFKARLREDSEISILETLYPLLQGYDSVAIKADVEIGGTDQTFNLLMGRKVQRHFNMPEQDILTVPLIEGTDGIKKMSKSIGNYISLSETSKDMFGKIMAIPDSLIEKYFTLLTDIDMPQSEPYKAKMTLAETITEMYFSKEIAQREKENFIKMFSKKEITEDIPELTLSQNKMNLVDVLLKTGIQSRGEARRLIDQRAIQINQVVVSEDGETTFSKGDVLKVGKKKFFRIK